MVQASPIHSDFSLQPARAPLLKYIENADLRHLGIGFAFSKQPVHQGANVTA